MRDGNSSRAIASRNLCNGLKAGVPVCGMETHSGNLIGDGIGSAKGRGSRLRDGNLLQGRLNFGGEIG